MAACQSWICFPLLQCHVFMVYVLLCWGVFFSVLRLYSKWSIVWGLKIFFSSSLSSCKKLYFLNTLSPVLSTPLSYVCCVCMDRLMANFAGTCTSDNKGLLLLLLHAPHSLYKKNIYFVLKMFAETKATDPAESCVTSQKIPEYITPCSVTKTTRIH